MADHVQQQILEAVQAVLVAAAIVPTGRVYLDRTDELPEDDLPAIDILGGDQGAEESIEYQTMHHPATQSRSFSFPITGVARGAHGAAKAARNLGRSVEAAIMATASTIAVGGRVIDMVLADSSERKQNGNALPMVAVSQTWQAQYHTTAGTPDVPR